MTDRDTLFITPSASPFECVLTSHSQYRNTRSAPVGTGQALVATL